MINIQKRKDVPNGLHGYLLDTVDEFVYLVHFFKYNLYDYIQVFTKLLDILMT